MDVRQNRVLIEVVSDHFRDEVINDFVVRDAGADGIRQTDIAHAIGIDQSRNAKARIFAKDLRIEKIVINPAINDVDRLQTFGRAHENFPGASNEIEALHNFDSHRAREERVLVISGIVDAGGMENEGGIRSLCRRDVTQNIEELLAVIFHWPDTVLREQIWKNRAHDLAVLHDIGNAGWAARIVLQHKKITVAIAHQIGAANVDVDILRHVKMHELRTEVRCLPDVIFGNYAIAQNGLAMIDVVQKKIESGDSLLQTALDLFPFLCGNNSRDEIERKNPLGALGVVVNGEGDPLAQESKLSQIAFAIEFSFRQLGETLQQPFVMRPGPARSDKHLIIKFARIVFGEEFGHEFSLSPALRHANKKECADAIIRHAAREVLARMRVCRWAKGLLAKMARFGSSGFLRPAPVSRWQRSRRRHRPLLDRYRQCNPLPRLC